MRELTRPVDLCESDGSLSADAIGWSRRPLHRCNLSGRRGRKKRWDFWCVTDEKFYLAFLVADIDYLRGGLVSLVDLATGKATERIAPMLGRCPLPETVGGAPVHFDQLGVQIDLLPRLVSGLEPGRLRVRARGIAADLELETPRDSLSVVVPGRDQFWYTCKQIGLGARGRVSWPGGSSELEGAWAALDFGRGLWPARTRWNWAAAARPGLAFNLGGRWTDGTGATENGLFSDGVLHKIDEELRFDGDRISGRAVDLRFTPVCARRVGLPPLAGLHWRAGRFEGRILDWKIDGLFGWNEALDILW